MNGGQVSPAVAELREKYARLDERINALEEYQDVQNGSTVKVERRAEGQIAKLSADLEKFKEDVSKRFDRLQWWLIGLLTSIVVSLVLQYAVPH